MSPLRLATGIVLAAALSACSTTSPDIVTRQGAQRLSSVIEARVVSVRPVTVVGNDARVGTVAGGAVGGALGATVGGRRERLVAGVLGATAGALAGNAIERAASREDAVEVVVQMPNGERRAIVQGLGRDRLQPGDRVSIVGEGHSVRVVRR